MSSIHPTALVHPDAKLGMDVAIGPYAVIGEDTIIGEGSSIGPHAMVGPHVHMGAHNVIHGHAAVGGAPQDLTWKGEITWLAMGDHNVVREFAQINRGTLKGDGWTRVGSHNLLMSCCHVGHDCVLGDYVVMANNALLAGHVVIEDRAILNGAAAVQQFATVGKHSYVGGLTRVVHDVPPFMVVEGHPSKVRKVNTVGMQRAGYSSGQMEAIREAYRTIFRTARPRSEILTEIEQSPYLTAEVAYLVAFLRRSERSAAGRALQG
ncbi:MAG: acyl-ACP--UDP-N-acetylglucosamine O-acyltransferase [Planctomycetes bacterium]|nr:acyl-ACP--UDP-N-acetylglucosamine O-acyltransferase [Planctomycetota bacterium]